MGLSVFTPIEHCMHLFFDLIHLLIRFSDIILQNRFGACHRIGDHITYTYGYILRIGF